MTDRAPEAIDASGSDGRLFGRSSDGGRGLRERTLDCLRSTDGPLSLTEIACRLVAEASDRDPATVPNGEVQSVYLELVRYQVPQLEQRGVVEYSRDDGTLQLVGPGTP